MEGLTQNEKIVWSCWETKTLREVVREAAAKGTHISLAHKFLRFKQSWDASTTEAWFTAEVFAWVLQLLSRKQFFKASHVLNKMQISPPKYMLDVAKDSLDTSLRDYIIDQLAKTANDLQKDDPKEWETVTSHWCLLQLLEQSFQKDGLLKQTKVFGMGKDLTIVTSVELKSLTIAKIQLFSSEWKKKIASYLFLEILDFSIVPFLEPEYLWNLLLQLNRSMILRRWICIYFSKEKNTDNESLQSEIGLLRVDLKSLHSLDQLKQLDALFVTWVINPEMVQSVSSLQCYEFTKQCVYDTLCIYGHIEESEKDKLDTILKRLSRTQNLGNIDKLMSRSSSTVTKTDMNNMLAKYCIENGEYHAMTTCIDSDLLDKPSVKNSSTSNCLDLWLLFKETANAKETEKYVASIYETCKYVSENDLDTYFSENPSLVLALIIFTDQKSIFEIFNNDHCLTLPNATVKWQNSFNRSLPHLYSVFQKYKNNSLVIENDVNVYQLLTGYKGLDISKIFEFQLVEKRIKKQKSEASVRKYVGNTIEDYEEMPHFANRKLVRKHGYQKKLNFIYYLKQNRPCMASQALLIQQFQRFGRLSSKIINEACTHAHTLALQNWNDPIISGSCISFITMIGGDSIKCRTHITCANIAANFLEAQQDKETQQDKEEVAKSIDKGMLQLTANDYEAQSEFLSLLETASMIELKKYSGISSQCVDISKILDDWQSVIRFAYFHHLPAPTAPLQFLVDENMWIAFLIFGDVFKYPQTTMLALSKGFSSQPLAEHLCHAICNPSVDEHLPKEGSKQLRDELRKISKGSLEPSPSEAAEELEFSMMGDIWEVIANCHGPEDPPGALLRASATLHCPILALLATCYEPDAVDICWAQWVLSSIRRDDPNNSSVKQWDPSGSQFSETRAIQLMEICLADGYYKTLYESFTIFYRDSPLSVLMKFILQTVLCFDFGEETKELLKMFSGSCGRRESVIGRAESSWLPKTARLLKKKFIQTASLSIVRMTLSNGFKSLSHQKSFAQLLCEGNFSKEFSVASPDWTKIIAMLDFSMDCNILLNIGDMCGGNAVQFQKEYLENLVENKMYEKALEFAKVVDLPVEQILIADWTDKYNNLNTQSDTTSQQNEISNLVFWTQCSLSFREASANPMVAVKFLKAQCDQMSDSSQKFYILRLILSWFNKLSEDALTEMKSERENIEFEMWMAFLSCENDCKLQLLGEDATYSYILKENTPNCLNTKEETQVVFKKLLNEIEQESNAVNMSIKGHKLNIEEADRWFRGLARLLECGLVEEAWRLSKMFSAPQGYNPRTLCTVQLVETCLHLAEGTITSYELPQSLRMAISSSSNRFRLSDSQCSDTSFEELVLIPEKQEEQLESTSHVVGRREADCLSSLETFASKSGLRMLKQVASIYRISLQIGWPYVKVLKYDGNPLDLINFLSGRSRMPLAKIIFSMYEIPTEKIEDYLCLEIVGAVISPHLTRTSGFRQKEHFKYTLWGFPLDSDFEIFLNLRPNDNSMLGRMILDHLTAFRKLYKTDGNVAALANADFTEVEDVEVIIDEEYQNIDDYEVESVMSQQSGSTLEYSSYNAGRGTSIESQSVVSESTIYSPTQSTREKKPQFDVISCTNIRIKSAVKSNMKMLLKGAKLSSKQVNVITIELLVLAHECFSSVCDTEGIATVLRSAQTLTLHLLAARSWRLMVRLVTGLARYTEMAYVFQMLRDNHQFEFLLGQFDYMLGQHQEKITSFKQGLLEFLKRHCPGDTEIYCLVALHFSMFSEAADVKKKQANDLIVTMIQIALDSMKVLKKRSTKQPEWILLANSDSNRLLLDTAINHCTDSAELYCKGGCLGAAREMAGLAQLLALQISLLPKAPARCILNLPQDKITSLIDSYLSFMEGLVFAQAVDGGGGGWICRWRGLVFRRVLRGDDSSFIKDIVTLRPDIACYIIERYETEKPNKVDDIEIITELRSFFKQ